MKPDPIVAEVRKTREELCRRFDNDPRRYFEYLQDLQKELEQSSSAKYPPHNSEALSFGEEQ
jgi:hypothetical protein